MPAKNPPSRHRRPPSRTEQARPDRPRPDQARPNQARPNRARPDKARPDKARPDEARTDRARSDQARPHKARPDQVRPNQVRAGRPPPDRPTADRPKAEGAWGGAWLYGRHAVTAALANPARRVRRLVALAESSVEARALVAAAAAKLAGAIEILERAQLEELLPRDAVHQGFALAAEPLAEPNLAEALAALPASTEQRQIVVLLDRVSDPHNVGAILRSAAAFGVVAVVVPEHGAPPVTGALAKAASGALETVPLVRVANLSQALETLKDAGFWCLGLDGEARDELSALDLAPRIALVLGAEGEGLRRLTRERCDVLVRLATRHHRHSLNVSNAAAVALYDIAMRKPA